MNAILWVDYKKELAFGFVLSFYKEGGWKLNIQDAKDTLRERTQRTKSEGFFEKNLETKLVELQPEHLLVLKVFYDIANELNNLEKNEEMKTFKDVSFSDVMSKIDLPERVVEVCYQDLLRDGFILMTHSQKLYHYITPLGIMLIRFLK